MIEHYPYRFKTKDEFIKEFSKQYWRNAYGKSYVSFVKDMDYLFGQIYPFDINLDEYDDFEDYLPNDDQLLCRNRNIITSSKWIICKFMLTINKPLIPDYTSKNKIKRVL